MMRTAERAIQESHALLQAVVEGVADALFVKDRQGRFLFVNSAGAGFIKKSVDEIIGKFDADLFAPDTVRAILKDDLQVMTTGETLTYERAENVAGIAKTFLITKSPYRNPEGAIVGVIGIARDVTESKKLQAEKYRLLDQLRVQINRLPFAYLLMDAEIRILDWNPVAEKMFGYTKEEVLGRNPLDLILPLPVLSQVQEVVRRLQAGDMDAHSVNDNRTKDGRIITCEWFNTPLFDAEGRFFGIISVAQDITERKRGEQVFLASESRFRAFMANSPGLTFVTNEHGQFVYANERWKRLFSKEKDDWIGKTSVDLFPAELARKFQGLRIQVLGTGQSVEFAEIVPALDGTPHHWLIFLFPIEQPLGTRLLGGTAIDITTQMEAEIAVRKFADRLQILRIIDRGILTAESPQAIAQRTLDRLHELIPCPRSGVAAYDLDASEGVVLASCLDSGQPKVPSGKPFSLDVFGEVGSILKALSAGQPYVIDLDDFPESSLFQIVRSAGVRYLTLVPLVAHKKLIGALHLGTYVLTELTEEQLEIARDVADLLAIALKHAQLFEQATADQRRLESLSQRLMSAQEQERAHLSRELHDEIGQQVTGLKIMLKPSVDMDANAFKATLDEARNIADELLDRIRGLSFDLRPAVLDQLGLLPALLALFERYTKQTGVRIDFKQQGMELRFLRDLETAAYRIVQEALTNIARHANVNEATVRVWAAAMILNLQIDDRGSGFDPQAVLTTKNASGLVGMQERATSLGGRIFIESRPDGGTRITAELPIHVHSGKESR